MEQFTKIKIVALLLYLFFSHSALAAANITVDLNTQKFIGGVSNLDREKYFNFHTTFSSNRTTESELEYLINDLNMGFGRNFWGPFSAYSGNAPYPTEQQARNRGPSNILQTKNHPNYNRFFSNRNIITDHPRNAFVAGEDPVKAAEWAANYFKYYFDDTTRPLFYEPINEPLVHAGEFGIPAEQARRQMIQFYAEIGKKFDQKNIPTKVIGYASAWPSMELWDFRHFNTRMKLFMDVAGPHMDSFSVHLYDGVNITGADSQRSGSNAEAILDLIETYSHYKWDVVKPHTVSEYGGIERGYPSGYSDVKFIQSVRSMNHILFELLDRQDRLLTSIPFATGKSSWHYNAGNNWTPYGAALLRPNPNSIVNGRPTQFWWTSRIRFFELWSDVKGKRVKALSDNEDVQVQAFVSGRKAYLALNNLSERNQTLSLDFVNDMGQVTGVSKKQLKIFKNRQPIYVTQAGLNAPSSVSLISGETVIYEYVFSNPVALDNRLDVKHYYSDDHLKTIVSGRALSFAINNVDVRGGHSVLKMAIGRKHDKSKSPLVRVNGVAVDVPNNWPGGDQRSRSDFFGTIPIPVENTLLNRNNMIEVTFDDAGGRVSSMILEVHNEATSTPRVEDTVRFVDTITSLTPSRSYSVNLAYRASERRDVVLELWKDGTFITSNKVTVGSGSGQRTIRLGLNARTTDGETGYALRASIRPVNGSRQQSLETKRLNNISIEDAVSPVRDSIAFVNSITELPSRNRYSVAVAYEASTSRDLVMELWNGAGWIASGSKRVNAGAGTVNLVVELSSPASAGTGYILKASIRPVNATWRENLEFQQLNGIRVRSSGSGVTPPGGWTSLKIRHSGKCMDVARGRTENGTGYHQWGCDSQNINQRFEFLNRGNGYWSLRAQRSNKCVDLRAGSAANGAKIQQHECTDNNGNQRWKLVEKGSGWFEIRNQGSGKCLEVANSAQGDGVKIQQWQCNNRHNQQFKFR